MYNIIARNIWMPASSIRGQQRMKPRSTVKVKVTVLDPPKHERMTYNCPSNKQITLDFFYVYRMPLQRDYEQIVRALVDLLADHLRER